MKEYVRPLLPVTVVIGLAGIAAVGISVKALTESPKDVVQKFVNMDVEGERITSQGWRRADTFFLQPSQPSRRKILVVIAKHYGVSEVAVRGNTAEFYMGYEELGRINSSLHFSPSDSTVETRSMYKYNLVLTDANRKLVTDEKITKEVNGPFEWRIEGAQPAEMHITVDTAIRYVTQMRDKAKDPIVKRNADKALAMLRSYR
jgi:hypothetical protein